jgi:Tol biopolymer transport system component
MKTISLIFMCIMVIICGCAEQEVDEGRASPSSSVEITPIVNFGKSLDWCPANDMMALGRMGRDFYYDVYIMNPDGTGLTCLTDAVDCPQKHNGNPAWHPSGEYIIFTAENGDVQGAAYDKVAIPGRGVNCNLWVVNREGFAVWQLTDYETSYSNPKGVLHPQVTHDGTHVFWAERLSNSEGTPWGEWALVVADFIIDERGPHLEHEKVYQPGKSHRFYESHAFSLDDEKILFCGNVEKDQLESGIDICEMDLSTGSLTKLTDSFSDWDEHAHYSPDGSKIAWMSSTGLDVTIGFEDLKTHQWPQKLKTELWIMDADGSHKEQVTHFNQPKHEHHIEGEVIVSDSTWNPDGSSIAATIAIKKGLPEEGFRSQIILITFNLNYTVALHELIPMEGFSIVDFLLGPSTELVQLTIRIHNGDPIIRYI